MSQTDIPISSPIQGARSACEAVAGDRVEVKCHALVLAKPLEIRPSVLTIYGLDGRNCRRALSLGAPVLVDTTWADGRM